MIKGLILTGKGIYNSTTTSGFSYVRKFNEFISEKQRKAHPAFNLRATGPYRISQHLYQHGYDVEIIDYVNFFDRSDLFTLIEARILDGVKWIGVSVNFIQQFFGRIADLFLELKKKYPYLYFLVGGQNFGKVTNLNADVYIDGFSENAVVDVLDSYFKGKEFPNSTVIFDKAKHVDAIHTNPSWPLPDYSLRLQDSDFLTPQDVISIELERGCRFKCNFCEFPILGVKEDGSVSEQVIYDQLLSNYERYGIKYYFISDETVNSRNSKLQKLANAIDKLPFDPIFTGFVRLDIMHNNPEMIDLLIRCNIVGHHYGIETFNRLSGKIIGKGYDPEKNKDLLCQIRDMYGEQGKPFMGTCSMICGLPEQSLESAQSDVDWYNKYYSDGNMHFYSLNIANAYKLSAFGVDLDKFGYRVMDKEKFYEKMEGKYELHIGTKVDFDSYNNLTILWENDLMDIVDSMDFVSNFNTTNRIKMNNWSFVGNLAAGMDIHKQHDSNYYDETWETYLDVADAHINDYIDNKMLSLYM